MFSKDIRLLMIGWGPHATRTYSKFFIKYKFEPRVVVDLDSQHSRVKYELNKFRFGTLVVSIPNSERDLEKLSDETCKMLNSLCLEHEITHIIIAVEPKAHYAYLDYFIEKRIHILVEKPIIAPLLFYTVEDANKTRAKFYDILKRKNPNYQCKVMCQRKFNKGYMYAIDLATEIVKKYNCPITKISVSHCDGNWMMPHDMFYENHPYKYGYGKLFHSGYHFIDLFADISKINKELSEDKKPKTSKIFTNFQLETDDLVLLKPDEIVSLYKKLGQDIPEFYTSQITNTDFGIFGEKAIDSHISYQNADGRNLMLGSLYISQIGFSRRAWILAHEDHYKNNGRVRHESVDIEIGPLANIKIESYQSKELKDRADKEDDIGGLDHFDIYVFKNAELIGGVPFIKISSKEFMNDNSDKVIRGLNEDSREDFIYNFFSSNYTSKGELESHSLGIEMLHKICVQEIMYKNGEAEIITFDVSKLI